MNSSLRAAQFLTSLLPLEIQPAVSIPSASCHFTNPASMSVQVKISISNDVMMCFTSTFGKWHENTGILAAQLGQQQNSLYKSRFRNWSVDTYGKQYERILQIRWSSLVPCTESLQARQLLVCPIDLGLCHMSPASVNLAHWGARKSLPRWTQPSNRSPYLKENTNSLWCQA